MDFVFVLIGLVLFSWFWKFTVNVISADLSVSLRWFEVKSSHSQLFFKIGILKNFAIFTGKQLCLCLFLIKLQPWSYNFIKKRLQYRCFPVNIAKFLRTFFFTAYQQWTLVLYLAQDWQNVLSISFVTCVKSISRIPSHIRCLKHSSNCKGYSFPCTGSFFTFSKT